MLIAMLGEKLTDTERSIFTRFTGRQAEPLQRVEEFWGIVGRRGGKTRAAAVLSVYLAALCDYRDCLARGETGLLLYIAANQKQAQIAFQHAAAIFDAVPTPSVARCTVPSVSISAHKVIHASLLPTAPAATSIHHCRSL
jgi:hypothetical protein